MAFQNVAFILEMENKQGKWRKGNEVKATAGIGVETAFLFFQLRRLSHSIILRIVI